MTEKITELTDELILCRSKYSGKRISLNFLVKNEKLVDIYCHYLLKDGNKRRCTNSGRFCKFFEPNGEIKEQLLPRLK